MTAGSFARPAIIHVGPLTENPFSAKDGKKIGGNKTEIQNTYAPGSLYDNLGYEPLYESAQSGGFFGNWQGDVKDFGEANAGSFGTMFGSAIGGGHGAPSGASKIGGGIGSIAGNAIGGPLGGVIGKGIGSLAGGIIGGAQQRRTEKFNNLGMDNVKQAAFQSGMQGMQQNQFGAFMEDGGEVGLKYLSHDWQPQVISKFGDYDVKDLLREDPTMDTLRAGGNVGKVDYTAPSARAMQTYDMGGELQTHWGGYVEPISYNPYLPDGGVTMMPRGQSHEESDGQGNTGIGITFGNNPVEVERGEPMNKLKDGGNEESLVVYGNMKIPSYGVSELGKDAKNKKFKNYANDISKLEAKQNKIVEKGTELINNSDPNDIYELLASNSGKAMEIGGNMKLKTYAGKKILASGIQNAILDTAEEMGVESDALSRGIIKPIKDSNMAKMGGKFTKAQAGIQKPPVNPALRMINPMFAPKNIYMQPSRVPLDQMLPSPMDESGNYYMPGYQPYGQEELMNTEAEIPQDDLETSEQTVPNNFLTAFLQGRYDNAPSTKKLRNERLRNTKEGNEREKTTLADVFRGARTLLPYLRGTNQEAIDPNQFSGEMLALATNQLQPVKSQSYVPQLETPYSVSFQDQMNANQSDFNAMQRQYGYNPAAASQLAAQKYAANSAILGQQARANQEMQMGAYNRNRGVLNDSTIKNLAILDSQYQRQEQAKSNTKMQAQVALNSIASKLAQHKLENRKLGIQENMYNYRFGPNGRAINENAPYEFNMEGNGSYANNGLPTLPEGLEYSTEIRQKKKTKGDNTARNGSIVKAIKNL